MIDSNLYQRDHLLPSEKAWAYKMRLDTMKQQGKRTDLTSCNVCTKSRADENVASDTQVSARTIQNFIRLTYLLSPLLDMVDADSIPFTAGVSVSFLPPDAQQLLLTVMRDNDVKSITRSQGEELKAFKLQLNEETILRIFGKNPKAPASKPQIIKLQVDYSPAITKRLAKDQILQARIRAVIEAYIKETAK